MFLNCIIIVYCSLQLCSLPPLGQDSLEKEVIYLNDQTWFNNSKNKENIHVKNIHIKTFVDIKMGVKGS